MKKSVIGGALMLLLTLTAMAGQKLDLKSITNGDFAAETLAGVEPLADGETYARISDDGKRIVAYSFKTGKQTAVLFDAATARGPQVYHVDGYTISPDGSHLLIQTQTKSIYRRSKTATYYIYTIQNNKLEPLSDGGQQQSPVWSPDGNVIAFVRDNNIFLVKLLYDNAESQVTKDGRANEVINGIPDWVYEEEFSTNVSMVFSANSQQLVWIRYDESQVPLFTLPEYSYKYPKAGEQNSKVSVLSYDIKSHQTRTLALPLEPDGYIPRILPTQDPAKVAVVTMNRHQDQLRIYMCNPLSTVCQLVVEDKVEKYIKEEVLAGLKMTSGHILLPSERDGYNHLYLYALNGQLIQTVGDQEKPGQRLGGVAHTIVTDVYGYDELTGDIYYAALNGDPTNQKVYVTHKNGKTDCLTPKDGWNTAIFSSDFKYFVSTWSDLNTPTVYALCNNQGKTLTTLIDNKTLKQKYDSYDMGTKDFFVFSTPDEKFIAWMVKPKDFNPQKKYPVIMYQYGGPGSQQVKNAWGIGMSGQGAILEQYLSQQGYICVCVDNRGTGGRGAEFEKCTYLRLGELEARDQVEAAIWLGNQPYVDKDRIAIWGWSYGGWNTLMAMSEGRPVFRCGVAIAPPTCWRYYDTIYTERYMRTPQENPQGYDEVNPIARARQLHGELLICHGLSDDNVHYQNTADYVESLVQADKDFRQLVYTGRNHSIYGGNTRNHLFRQCINHFNAELK